MVGARPPGHGQAKNGRRARSPQTDPAAGGQTDTEADKDLSEAR